MKTFAKIFGILLTLIIAFSASGVAAHGSESHVDIDGNVVTVNADYDDGEGMGEAQVVVYAPDNGDEPWLTGVADADGLYSFEPDTSIVGEWKIELRSAGHGETLYVMVNDDGTISADEHSAISGRMVLIGVAFIAALGIAGFYFGGSGSEEDEQPMGETADARS